jgi:tellurite methyltransferase
LGWVGFCGFADTYASIAQGNRASKGTQNSTRRRGDAEKDRLTSEEKNRWDTRYTESPESWTEPDDYLKRAYEEFLTTVPPGRALDLAGGAGRNSLFLLQRGWQVKLVDISEVGLSLAKEKAAKLIVSSNTGRSACATRVSLETEILDLNTLNDLGENQYDLVVVFYFLRRDLFPAIIRALKPGGFLVYRTYTIDRMKVPGGPEDPRYLLQPNELLRAFSALRVLHYHETTEGKAAAELVGRKTA